MSSSDVGLAHGEKSSWPEVVGKPLYLAKLNILKDRPDVKIIVLRIGTVETSHTEAVRNKGKHVLVFVKHVIKKHNTEAEETILGDKPETEIVGLPFDAPVTEDSSTDSNHEIVMLPVPRIIG